MQINSFCLHISEGKRHDARMLTMSGLLEKLQQHSFAPDGTPLCLYGDPAYPLRAHLQGPYKHTPLTVQERDFNVSMSTSRVSVEWVFGDIVCYWKYLDFKRNLKIGLSAIGKHYLVAALLRNALTCLYGCSTSTYFNIPPPELETYFV